MLVLWLVHKYKIKYTKRQSIKLVLYTIKIALDSSVVPYSAPISHILKRNRKFHFLILTFFRERAPPIFCAPQNITKHTLSFISALYSLNFNPESNSRAALLTSVKNWLICNGWRIINFRTKILSEDPYLKFFISRVRTKHRERFCSFSRCATRLPVEEFFLPPLPPQGRWHQGC